MNLMKYDTMNSYINRTVNKFINESANSANVVLPGQGIF